MFQNSNRMFRRRLTACFAAFAAGSLQIPQHAFGEWGGVGGYSSNDPQVLNPTGYDDDGDGLPSLWEEGNGFNALNPADALSDFDMDGLTALQEYQLYTATSGLFGNSRGKWSMTAVAAPTGFTPAPQVTVVEVASNGIILARVSGKLTGQTTTSNFSYTWTPSTGTWQRIPGPAAFPAFNQMVPLDVNASGQVVGHFNSVGTKGFIWTPGPSGGTTSVYGLDSGGVTLNGIPTRISDSGFVVGRVSSLAGRTFAARPDQSEIIFPGWTTPVFKDVNDYGEFLGTVLNPLTSKIEQFIAAEGLPVFFTGISADDVQGSGGPWGSVPDIDVAQIVWDTSWPRQGTVIDRTTGGVVEFSEGFGSEPFWKSPFTTDGSTPLWYTMPNFHAPVVGTMNGWGEFVGSYTWEMGESYLDSNGMPVDSGLTNTGSFFFDGQYHFTEASSTVIGVSSEPRVLLGPAPFSLWCGAMVTHIGGLIPSGYPTSFSSARISEGGDIVLQQSPTSPLYILKLSQDADGDGMPDDWEEYHDLNPNNAGDAAADADGDGYSNITEFQYRIDPTVVTVLSDGRLIDLRPGVDTDGDGMPDVWEWKHGLLFTSDADAEHDFDGDGLTSLQEFYAGTDPTKADTDGDGVSDGNEVQVNFTNPLLNLDADNDGIRDDFEKHLAGMLLMITPDPVHWGPLYAGLTSGNLNPAVDYTDEGVSAEEIASLLSKFAETPSGNPLFEVELQSRFCTVNATNYNYEEGGSEFFGTLWVSDPAPHGTYSDAAFTDCSRARLDSLASSQPWVDLGNPGWPALSIYKMASSFVSLNEYPENSDHSTLYSGGATHTRFRVMAKSLIHDPINLSALKVTRDGHDYTSPLANIEPVSIVIPKGKFFSSQGWVEMKAPMKTGTNTWQYLAQVDVVDKDLAPVSELKVGKMEGTLDDMLGATNLNIDLDQDRFHVTLTPDFDDASIKLGTVGNPIPDYDDDLTKIKMVDEGGYCRTEPLLLVADDTDDDYSNTNAPYEVPGDDQEDDRTHKIQLGGDVIISSIHIEGSDYPLGLRIPVPVKKTVNVGVVILRHGGHPVIHPDDVGADLVIARERFAQVGIQLTWSMTVADSPPGVNLADGLDEFATPGNPTAEETALFSGGFITPAPGDIQVIYVNFLSNASKGESFRGGTFNAPFSNNVVISGLRGPFTLAHELTHIVANIGIHHDSVYNLLRDGTSPSNALGSSKRLTAMQQILMWKSGHAK